MGAQTGTSDNSHTTDFTPCHQPAHLKQIYRAAALLLDSVWLQQIRDRWGNRISCLTSGTFSHPAISQCHFGIISLLAMIHDWNSFWPWVLRENVWHAVEKKWEMVALSKKKNKKTQSTFCITIGIIKPQLLRVLKGKLLAVTGYFARVFLGQKCFGVFLSYGVTIHLWTAVYVQVISIAAAASLWYQIVCFHASSATETVHSVRVMMSARNSSKSLWRLL